MYSWKEQHWIKSLLNKEDMLENSYAHSPIKTEMLKPFPPYRNYPTCSGKARNLLRLSVNVFRFKGGFLTQATTVNASRKENSKLDRTANKCKRRNSQSDTTRIATATTDPRVTAKLSAWILLLLPLQLPLLTRKYFCIFALFSTPHWYRFRSLPSRFRSRFSTALISRFLASLTPIIPKPPLARAAS
jgi:hypothetical protein